MALTKIPGNLIQTGAITAAALDDDAVTTAKVLDANITHAKLHATMDLTGKTVTVATAAGSTNTTAAASTAFVQQELTSGLAPKATIASPTFTGTPSAPTASGGTNTTALASTAFVQQELTTLIGGAPSTLNDLNELAAAINDDDDYHTTLTTALATKLPLAGGAMTGAITTNSTFDGVDIAARDAVLTSTTTTANAALPKAGGTMTGALTVKSPSATGEQLILKIENAVSTGAIGKITFNQTNDEMHLSNEASGSLVFDIATVEKMRIDSLGNVLFGNGNSHSPKIQGTTNSGRTPGSPGYSFNDDLDTGMFQPLSTPNTVAFSTGGTERLRIKSDGKVGIGTSIPSGRLTIANPTAYAPNTITAANSYIQLGSTDYGSGGNSNNDGKFMIGFGYTGGVSNTNSPAYIGFEEVNTSGATYGDLTFYTRPAISDIAPTERLRIKSNGTASFSGKLSVKTVNTSHANNMLEVAGNLPYASSVSNLLTSVTNAAARIQGASDASNSLYLGALTTGAYPYMQSSNYAGNAAVNMVLQPFGGNVGIGTTNPAHKLHVHATSGSEPLGLFQTTSAGDCAVRIEGIGGEAYLEIANTSAGTGNTSNSWGIGCNDDTNLHIAYGTNSTMNKNSEVPQFYINSSTGNVGVGTANPDATLHVNGAAIIGGNQNNYTTPAAGLHVLDHAYSKWSTTLSPEQCALRVETYHNGSDGHPRAAGDYGGGIVFNHLGGHSATHGKNMHCWIGPRIWDIPGRERSGLVFATNDDTTTQPAAGVTTIEERMVIDPYGNVGIGISPAGYVTSGYALRLDGGTQTYLSFNNNTHTTQVLGGFIIGNDAGAARITQRQNQPMIFSTNDTTAMTIAADGIVTKPYQPAFSAYANTSETTGVNGIAPFDALIFDQGSNYTTSTRRFTAPVAGIYQFSTYSNINGVAAGGVMWCAFAVNNVYRGAYMYQIAPTSSWNLHGGTQTIKLAEDDYVQVKSGTSMHWDLGNAAWSNFSGHLVG